MDSNTVLRPPEKVTADVSWVAIDRMDWQLGLLAILLILVLGTGLLSFMFPAVFWPSRERLLAPQEPAFYGLCALLGLTMAYLLQRQIQLRRLKRGLMIERKGREEELIHGAYHDALTGLPNRILLLDRLTLALSRANRHKQYQFAVIFIDLDRFKMVNDSMGHRTGDLVLREVARRLLQCMRTEDTVARLGGDEFAILLENVKHISDLSRATDRIKKDLSLPVSLEGREIFTSASMGIALSSTGYENAEDLLRDSDTAMYRAKAQGTAQYVVFDASMHEYAVKILSLETALRRALERDELLLYYQPIVWLRTGQVAGLEALVRWRRSEHDIVPPSEFLQIAETSGMLADISRSVLHQACNQARKWQVQYPSSWPLSITVNLPAKFLANENHVEEIISIISKYGIRPHKIRLEITENQLMENAESIKRALLRLRDFGTRIYIDDFGTGFSSLSYLSTFQVDAFKIDQSFVSNLNGNDTNSSIVRSVISLGHNLGIDVIAEGVETAEQLSYLQTVRCQYGQGYYFSKPLEPDEVGRSLEEWFPPGREKWALASRLAAFELFFELDHENLLEIAQTCEEVLVESGAVIIREGQVGDFAYLMEEGSVGIYKGDNGDSDFIAVLHASAVFGEMALVNPEGIRTASVKALSDLRLLTFPIIPCLSFLRRFPAMKQNLLRLIAERSSRKPSSL
jgi:diguanylate cyclase (GGDEF)-like protein